MFDPQQREVLWTQIIPNITGIIKLSGCLIVMKPKHSTTPSYVRKCKQLHFNHICILLTIPLESMNWAT